MHILPMSIYTLFLLNCSHFCIFLPFRSREIEKLAGILAAVAVSVGRETVTVETLIGKYFSVILDIISHNNNDRMSNKNSNDKSDEDDDKNDDNDRGRASSNSFNKNTNTNRTTHNPLSHVPLSVPVPPPHFDWQPSSHLKATFEVLLRACPSKAWHFHDKVLGQILLRQTVALTAHSSTAMSSHLPNPHHVISSHLSILCVGMFEALCMRD